MKIPTYNYTTLSSLVPVLRTHPLSRLPPTESESLNDRPVQCFYAHCAASISPRLSAKSALTSVTYCRPSSKGIRCSRSLSVGSLIHPSIGIALSGEKNYQNIICRNKALVVVLKLTLVKYVAQRAIIQYHDL